MQSARRNISLREWRTFCVAAEHTTFRDAAEQLHVTASAVSHQIKNLESELGKKLFERGTREVRLTEAGERLFADLRPLIRQLDEISARHANVAPRSTLRISVQPFFASELFVPRLAEFRERHPEIDIAVDTSDESSERHPASADVSIRVFKSPPSGLACERLFPLRLVPAGSLEYYDGIKVTGKRIVSDFPIVIHESRPRAWQQWEKASGIRLPKNVRAVRMDSMIAVARAAERGLGAALVPLRLSDAWFRSSALVPLFERELLTTDVYYFVSREELTDREDIALLRQWALQEFGD